MTATCGPAATRSRYVNGCRCTDCRAANRRYAHAYWHNHRKHHEGTPHVPITPELRDHLDRLRTAGMGYRAIANAAGLGHATVRELLTGRRIHGIRPETARALLACTYDPRRYPAIGLTRRLRALARLGWTQDAIAHHSGVRHPVIGELMSGNQTTALRHNADAIITTYNQLSMRLGPSRRSARLAELKGWPAPLAWDDDTIDDPAAHPTANPASHAAAGPDEHDEHDEAAVIRAIAGDRTVRLRHADRVEIVRRLTAAGYSQRQIAATAGIKKPDRYLTRTPDQLPDQLPDRLPGAA